MTIMMKAKWESIEGDLLDNQNEKICVKVVDILIGLSNNIIKMLILIQYFLRILVYSSKKMYKMLKFLLNMTD